MDGTKLLFALVIVSLVGCAQVPKEAVELSATVGRDLSEMKKSHVALVDLYYSGLISDINSFVDNVYLPYQIQRTLADDLWKTEMLSAIESASQPDNMGLKQKESFEKIQAFLIIIQQEVESYRTEKLGPVRNQYANVISSINQSYEQIHYSNSIVTGHLASVVKVHDTQNEILDKLDLKDMRVDVGNEFAGASEKIAKLVDKANDGNEDLGAIVSELEDYLNSESNTRRRIQWTSKNSSES